MTTASAAALRLLAAGPRSGRDLRDALAAEGIRLRVVAFYAMMDRMEQEGLVTHWDVEKEIDGVPVKERWYRH